MKYPKIYRILLLSVSILFCEYTWSYSSPQIIDPPKPYGAIPSKSQEEWQKMEYYMFIHFGPNTFTNVEWGDGKEDPRIFNPTGVDCKQWAETAKNAGMKGIILTAKHHDGFCLWPSQYSTHTIRESPWKDGKGDILKELSEVCKEYGLKFGVYLSPWDQNHPAYGTPEYNQIFANTLGEVLGNYGEVFEQWFDGANGGDSHDSKTQVYDWNLFHNAVYEKQPQAIIFSDIGPGCRWMGNERGMAGKTNWSTLNIKGFGPGSDAPPTDTLNIGNINGEAWVPSETDVSIRPGWFYSPSTDDKIKTLEQLLDIYYTSVGRNSNLLLNVPPDRTGRIHKNDSIRLIEFKRALDQIFSNDLAIGAKVKASNTRGNLEQYEVSNLLNENYDSYWTTNDDVLTASIDIELNEAESFNNIVLQEYIPLGQRIAKFNIEVWIDNMWKEIASGTTIGYKRILKFPSVTTQRIRINIQNSLACPILNKISLFKAPEQVLAPIINRDKDGLVSIKCNTMASTIYYTIDGAEPSVSSKIFNEEFSFPEGGVVKAIATISDNNVKSEITSTSFDIAPTQWSIVSPRTAEIKHIIDSNSNSYSTIDKNESVVIDLGTILNLKGFSYTPLADENANNIYKYNFYTSEDGLTWRKVINNGSFDNIKNNPIKQNVQLKKSIKTRFIKLEPLETTINKNGYTISEIGVITR